ncbi:unnamed protein product [Ectocarpus sp. 12 AP-2014]
MTDSRRAGRGSSSGGAGAGAGGGASRGIGAEAASAGAASGGSAGAGAAAACGAGATASGASSLANVVTPEKGKATFAEKWTPKQETTPFPLDPPVNCNRPRCKEQLQRFVPPGTNSEKGVTFGKCRDPTCAGGGTFLTYDLTCFVCHRTIPGGTIALSLKIADRSECVCVWIHF